MLPCGRGRITGLIVFCTLFTGFLVSTTLQGKECKPQELWKDAFKLAKSFPRRRSNSAEVMRCLYSIELTNGTELETPEQT